MGDEEKKHDECKHDDVVSTRTLSSEDLDKYEAKFAKKTFTREDIEVLFKHFDSADTDKSGLIDKKQFQHLLHLKDGAFTDKLFVAFDDQKREKLDFNDFINNLSNLHQRAPKSDKIEFSKKIYGIDGKLTQEDLQQILQDDMKDNGIGISSHKINDAVNDIFEDLADSDGLKFSQLVGAANLNPGKNLSLNINHNNCAIKQVLKDDDKIASDAHKYYEKEKENIEKERKRRSTRWFKLARYCSMHPNVVVWLAIYIILNCLIFPAGLWTIKPIERQYFSWGIYLAKCFRMVIYLNVPILFLLMCRQTLAWLRKSQFLFKIFPFDSVVSGHRMVGWVLLVAAVGHAVGHYKDFYVISHTPLDEINTVLKTPLDHQYSYARMLFGTISGVTGHVMLLCMAIMYPLTFLRRKKFEAFWYSHQLWTIFIISLFIHGTGKLLTTPIFYIIFLGPFTIFLIEMIYRFVKTTYTTDLIEAKTLPDKVTRVRVTKSDKFKYKAGQWVFVKSKKIAHFEWHAFTLTSAPHEDFLEVHIKSTGVWTSLLYEFALAREKALKGEKLEKPGVNEIKHAEESSSDRKIKEEKQKKEEEEGKVKESKKEAKIEEGVSVEDALGLEINIDGPFGAPAQNFGHYNTVVLFAAGIGVTPFASVIKHILYKMKVKKDWPVHRVYFIWTARSQKNFTWFTEVIQEAEEFNEKNKRTFDINLYFTGAKKEDDIRSAMLQGVLNYHYSKKKECLVSGLGSRVHFGRPNLPKIFDDIMQNHEKEKKIGVFYCGPPPLATAIRNECHNKKHQQKFKFHKENF